MDWQEGRGYRVHIEGMKLPIRKLENEIKLDDTTLYLTAHLEAKGFFSQILMGFIMKPILKRQLSKFAAGFLTH